MTIKEKEIEFLQKVSQSQAEMIKEMKAENERLRKEPIETPVVDFSKNPTYFIGQLEEAFKAALFRADADIDFDVVWNNYKKHILKIN